MTLYLSKEVLEDIRNWERKELEKEDKLYTEIIQFDGEKAKEAFKQYKESLKKNFVEDYQI